MHLDGCRPTLPITYPASKDSTVQWTLPTMQDHIREFNFCLVGGADCHCALTRNRLVF